MTLKSTDAKIHRLIPTPRSSNELQKAARSLKRNNAPGPEGVLPEVLKPIAKGSFGYVNACQTRGVFPIT